MKIKNRDGRVLLETTGADLHRAYLHRADLRGAELTGADLRWADLTGADLTGAELTGAKLRWADLTGAKLRWADLTGAELTGVDLRGADLRGADLRWADLHRAKLSETLRIYQAGPYTAYIMADWTAIGCERHESAKWLASDPANVAHMANDAAEWWTTHGPTIKQIIRELIEQEKTT